MISRVAAAAMWVALAGGTGPCSTGVMAQDLPAARGLDASAKSALLTLIAAAKQEGSLTYADTIIQPTTNGLIAKVPMGRFGQPEEVASIVRYLIVEGDYITGQCFNINGGMYM